MSENFDKEAERQRLREKYESDSADREVTERMSQLLLQGATMTNKHCETCNSPIFRHQGQEFCPTCQAELEATAESDPTAESEATAESAATTGEVAAAQPADGDDAGAQPAESQAGETAGEEDETTSETQPHESVGRASTGTAEQGTTSQRSTSQATAEAGGEAAKAATPPAAVTQSLSETIVALSDRARQSEDPNQAKALLEAAREAAETLSALQGR